MLNPVPFQLNADDGGLRLGFPALDHPDDRDLDDIGMTQELWELAMHRGRRGGWVTIRQALAVWPAILWARQTLSRN